MSQSIRLAVEGCGHGTLDAIYASVAKSCQIKGWDGVDLLIICGDFQAVRTQQDLNVTAMPAKYRRMGDFYHYYYGHKKAPYLTVFIGGNHEASNHLFELYYGGWVAPNIYYLGAANVIRFGPLKIAALSGIYEKMDYHKNHYERLPYREKSMKTIYRTRELDVRKLLSYRSQVDIGMSHDWPRNIEWLGDHQQLFRIKNFLLNEALTGQLGNEGAAQIMDRLRPAHWFSAHMHWKFAAVKDHTTFEDSVIEAAKSEYSRPKNWSKSGRQPESNPTGSDRNNRVLPQNPETAAWRAFAEANAAKAELAEKETPVTLPEDQSDLGRKKVANYTFEEVHVPVNVVVVDGVQDRQRDTNPVESIQAVPQYNSACASPTKRQRESDDEQPPLAISSEGLIPTKSEETSAKVTNPDALDLSMSDSDDEADSSAPVSAKAPEEPKTIQSMASSSKPVDDSVEAGPDDVIGTNSGPVKQEDSSRRPESSTKAAADVSDELRAELAGLSTNFAPEETIKRSADLPHPEAIKNTQTRFLALSKVDKNHDRDFLQLLEIEPLTPKPDKEIIRPIQLEYDPEWLAILRVFAPELKLGGNPREDAPVNRGQTYYRDRIIEEEKWVDENISNKGRLTIPLNFEVTTDENAATGKNDGRMPREQTNAQTSQFCELIDIENKFDFSASDRDGRMAMENSFQTEDSNRNWNGHGSHRGHRGGRGRGGRGRGRGRSGRW